MMCGAVMLLLAERQRTHAEVSPRRPVGAPGVARGEVAVQPIAAGGKLE